MGGYRSCRIFFRLFRCILILAEAVTTAPGYIVLNEFTLEVG
jgi:hypothetical protein